MRYLYVCVVVLAIVMAFFLDESLASSLSFDYSKLSNYESLNIIIQKIDKKLQKIFFYDVHGVPLIVAWIGMTAIILTARFNFVNVRLFGHAIMALCGKNYNAHDKGEISSLKAFFTAVSGAVGLGNIVGIAAAVQIGGPGAIFWMVVASFFIMTLKFMEVSIGHKYRTSDKNGNIMGGPFIYIKKVLTKKGFKKTGIILSVIFAILYSVTSLGGGAIFQANQTVAILSYGGETAKEVLAIILTSLVVIVVIGGIRRIAYVAMGIVPLMTSIYVISCMVIIASNIGSIGSAIHIIFSDAFSNNSVAGGVIGTMVVGMQRAAFASEAGIGSSSIEHAAAKTTEPIREGCISMLEPFIGTSIICTLTGLILVISGAHTTTESSGIIMVTEAFASVSSWFPIFLSISIPLFAFSTIITNCYHGERAFVSIFGTKSIVIYRTLFCVMVYYSCFIENFFTLLNFCDYAYLAATIPNTILLYIYTKNLKMDLHQYVKKHIK